MLKQIEERASMFLSNCLLPWEQAVATFMTLVAMTSTFHWLDLEKI
ncbi:putative conserved protein [Rhizobium favelukesii]|uniref:Conserved protein n=1 Tax=Rhizobium favelukesii TaxID=348824 RepID=W6RA85_9HYPH|nr:putative conserved protein [Rhizobium favelukesii]